MITLAQIILAGQRQAALEAVQAGMSARATPEDTVGPLLAALLQNDSELARALLQHGADPSEADSSGFMFPLYIAIRAGDAEMVSELIAAGASLNFRNRPQGRSALWLAAQSGNLEILRLLLDAGADPTLEDADGATPFAIAGAMEHRDCAQLLESRSSAQPASKPVE